MVKLYSSLLFIQFLFFVPASWAQSDVEKIIQEMTLEQKVGQLFVFGFKQQTYDASLKQFLDSTHPGGLLFFSRNGRSPQSVAQLIQGIKGHYKQKPYLEPLFMVDHEGGDVVRVGPSHFFPSALSIGKTQDPSLAYQLGLWTGRYLKSIGFDVNFAPVVDLRSEEKFSFIGERSFGSSPEEVVKMVQPFISGIHSARVLSVLKHFPGHGRVHEDSHKEIVRKMASLEELTTKDLLPFKTIIHSTPQIGVMTSHMSVEALDPTGELTTFSKSIVSKLSDTFQHDGLVFTDDLDMIFFKNKDLDLAQKVVDSLTAGHDQVLVVWSRKNQHVAYNAVLNAIKTGKMSEQFINDKLERILKTKLRLKPTNDNFDMENIKRSLAKIYTLQTKISQLHFQKVPKSLFEEIAEFTKSNKANYLFTFSNAFATEFKGVFDKGKFIPLSMENWDAQLQHCKKNLCFFHVSGDTSNKRLKTVPKDILPHLVLINTTDPLLTHELPSKKMNIYGVNKNIWKWIEKEIKNINSSYALVTQQVTVD